MRQMPFMFELECESAAFTRLALDVKSHPERIGRQLAECETDSGVRGKAQASQGTRSKECVLCFPRDSGTIVFHRK